MVTNQDSSEQRDAVDRWQSARHPRRLCRQRVGLSSPPSAPAPPFELVGYGLEYAASTRRFRAVAEDHGAHRIWEGWVDSGRETTTRRRADHINVAGPLAYGRVAGAGARID